MSIHKFIRYVGFLAIVGEMAYAQTQPYSGPVDATQFAGADVGDKVNAAIASFGSGGCGTIAVPHGNYSLSKKIVKPRCVMLDFQNSTVTSTITNGPSIVTGSFLDTSAGHYLWGGIRNLKLVGPGGSDSYGLWLGGDTTNNFAPAGYNDFGSSYYNINIRGFAYGVAKGVAYQISFSSSTLEGNTYGWYEPGQFGGENMSMFGMQFVNNSKYGVYAPNQWANEFNCSFCSFDYNGDANMYVMNGSVTLMGGHMERCSGYDIDGPVTASAAMILNIVGMTFVNIGGSVGAPGGCPAFSGVDPAYIHVTGNNSNVTLGGGVELIRNHKMTSVINWAATGLSNALNVEPYIDPASDTAIGLQILVPGQANKIQSLSIPLYNQYVSNNRYFGGITVGEAQGGVFPGAGSIYASGPIGTSVNQGGSLPSVAAFPYSGSYLSWNAENLGDVDLLSPVPVTTPNAPSYNFYVNTTGKFQKVFSILHNGGFTIGPKGSYGIDGSGDATVNSITLPNSGGISNSTTHFSSTSITIGSEGGASTWFTGGAAPSGACTTGDLWSNRSGVPNAFYVCQGGAWIGK